MRHLLFVLLFALPGLAWAEQPKLLTWDDLVPTAEPLGDPLAGISMADRFDLGFVAQVLKDERAGRIEKTWPEYLNALATLDQMKTRGVDTDGLVTALTEQDAEIARRGTQLVAELDQKAVRIPGYALPLETSADGVTEFLLVPYVGACIHTPPPPPNQIVYVKLDKPHQIDGLYEPVWITGTLNAQGTSRALSYVDGQANIATGYTLSALSVEPYE